MEKKVEEVLEPKKAQTALEFVMAYAWVIFSVLAIISVLSYFWFSSLNINISNLNAIEKYSLTGEAIFSPSVIEMPYEIKKNSELEIKLNPGAKGIYKFAYIYDKDDNLIKTFSFNCTDICYKQKSTQVFIDNSYEGEYYIAVFQYEEGYIKKEFKVVDQISKECVLKKAYWDKENVNEGQSAVMVLESQNCIGKTASFVIREEDLLFTDFVKEISRTIDADIIEVNWKAGWENDALVPILYQQDPNYIFTVQVNPEIASENALVITQAAVSVADQEFRDEGWYSWAGDKHNSRTANSVVAPPFKLLWHEQLPISCVSAAGLNLYYQDNRVIAVIGDSGFYGACAAYNSVQAYDATTGEHLWEADARGGFGSQAHAVLGRGHIITGTDHSGNIVVNLVTGEQERPVYRGGWMESYGNIDESGVVTYGLGSGTDHYGIGCDTTEVLFEPINQYEEGKFNNALRFQGDYLTIADDATLDPGTEDFTIMLWFKGDNTGPGTRSLFDRPTVGYTPRYNAFVRDGSLRFVLRPGSGYGESNFSCAADEWCHLALTYDHQKQKLYKNGELVYEVEQTGDIGNEDSNLYIGGSGLFSLFLGVIDEFAMFNRALPQAEIQEKMAQEITPDSSTSVLLHFNNQAEYSEDAGFVYDFSGNENNAVYDGHLNSINKAGCGGGKGCYMTSDCLLANINAGIRSNWGMVGTKSAGQGQPALNNGVVYVPDGILRARNFEDGSVVWETGVQPLQEEVGEVSYFSEVNYHNNVVYAMGRVNLEKHTADDFMNNFVHKIGRPPKWSSARLYGHDALTGEKLLEIEIPGSTFGEYIFQPATNPYKIIVTDDSAYVLGISGVDSIGFDVCKILSFDLVTGAENWQYQLESECAREAYSNFMLSDNVLYTTDTIAGKENIIGLDTATGQKIWSFEALDTSYFTSVIASDNKLFAITANGNLYTLEPGYELPKIINEQTALGAWPVGLEFAGIILTSSYFRAIDGEAPFSWIISSGSLPAGLELVINEGGSSAFLEGTPTESGDFIFTVRIIDIRGNSDEKQFTLRILPQAKTFSVSLQEGVDGYVGCEDSYIYSSNPHTNYGTEEQIIATDSKEALLKFKIFESEGGPVPDDAMFTKAGLSIYKTDYGKRNVEGFQILKDWKEIEVTWNQSSNIENWGLPGAQILNVDKTKSKMSFALSEVRAVYLPGGGYVLEEYSGPGPYIVNPHVGGVLPLIEGYDSGLENYGWLFSQPYSSGFSIYSCDYSNISRRPQLNLTYYRVNPDNQVPVLKLHVNPTTYLAGEIILLNASESYDPNGEIIEYEWCRANEGASAYALFSYACNLQCVDFDESTPWLCKTNAVNYHSFMNVPSVVLTYGVKASDEYGIYGQSQVVNVLSLTSFDSTTITTSMLKKGELNTAYSDFVYAEGGSGYTWTITSGTLPPGLTLNPATGEISGTPTQIGTYDFSISVSGTTGGSDEQALQIEVLDGSGQPPQTCTDGTAYSQCSATKPKYCQSGSLIDNCQSCSCNPGFTCQLDGTCLESAAECELTNAYWSTTSALEGEQVTLTLEGTNCEAEAVSFIVQEDDFVGDDSVSVEPSNAIFSAGKAETIWTAEYQLDALFTDPEYYFLGTLVSDAANSLSSGLLTITQAPPQCTDNDGDGYSIEGGECGEIDCDDSVSGAGINPSAVEICDSIDNNCNNQIDEGVKSTFYRDSDGDNYGNLFLSIEACTSPVGYTTDNTDCNDNNPNINPSATEICDNIDNNCNNQIDENNICPATSYYCDSDTDSFISSTPSGSCNTFDCIPSGCLETQGTDCNDGNKDIYPGQAETCDSIDNNCNNQIDEGVKSTFYQDSDNDNYGNPLITTQACSAPIGYVTDNTDCNDNNPAIKPGATETCDNIDNNCNNQIDEGVKSTFYQDSDNDNYGNLLITTQACSAPVGYIIDNTDCNDNNPAIKPGQTETCDNVDNNCNNQIDENNICPATSYYCDTDTDTFTSSTPSGSCNTFDCIPSGCSDLQGTDCNDNNINIYPGQAETCDNIDNNCNNQIDEGVKSTFYQDSDNDNFGDNSVILESCSMPQGYTTDNTDCNDNNLNINPSATETCDNIDNNCNNQIDEGVKSTFYQDSDNDNYGNALITTQACSTPLDYVADNTDCNDASPNINPGATETCDNIDNNCNNQIDENNICPATSYYCDADTDSFTSSIPSGSCDTFDCIPAGCSDLQGTDCNDNNGAVKPGVNEVCNGLDDNCQNGIDEGVKSTFYQDSDSDNYGNPLIITQACSAPLDYVADNTDCNDDNLNINPSATEICDSIDNNCNSQIDEGVKSIFYQDSDNDNYGNALITTQACSAPLDYVEDNTDCNDNNPNINPEIAEVCNAVDDNCQNGIDENNVCPATSYYCDSDIDTFTSSTPSGSCSTFDCIPAGCSDLQGTDCNDNNPAIKPGQTEICDNIDNNCNNQIDEGVQSTFYRDADIDGFGNPLLTTEACNIPSGYVTDNSDCNDENGEINPSALEICNNGEDNDCDDLPDSDDPDCACIINSLTWSQKQILAGEEIEMLIDSQNCKGKLINIIVMEKDLIDDDEVAIMPNIEITDTISWVVEFVEDAYGKPEYYFQIQIEGGTYNSGQTNEELLKVLPTEREFKEKIVHLKAGKNPFSLPLILENMSVEYVFRDLRDKAEKIYTYDSDFKIYHFDGKPSNLFELETGRGYIVFMNQETDLIIYGSKRKADLDVPEFTLQPGWNLIGTFSTTESVLSLLPGVKYNQLYIYNTISGAYEELTSDSELNEDYGYWINVTEESSFTPKISGNVVKEKEDKDKK